MLDKMLDSLTAILYTRFKTAVAYMAIGAAIGVSAMYFGGLG